MKRLLGSVLALLAGLALVSAGEPANAGARADWWRAQAVTALSKFISTDTGDGTAFGYGMAAYASGNLYGWTDARTTKLLAELRTLKNPDGGYGLNRTYDAFADGTVNPATTTYTVTLAGHVCPTLLAAYRNGAGNATEVQACVTELMAIANNADGTPRLVVPRGRCVPYSAEPADVAGGCVHNVNAGVGWFLQQANAAGFGATGMQKLITDITLYEIISYHSDTFYWNYIDDALVPTPGSPQDADHNSYSAEAMMELAHWVGRESAYQMMAKPQTEYPITHTRIAGMPGGVGNQSRRTPAVTLWCEMSDTWRTEQTTYYASLTLDNRVAQYAYYASRAALTCQPG